uniref:CPG4 domain-containing protein n=1 Tax=Panagrellus redivivus TaxID=6233 RepID=A0A7E4ULM5_PANRE
MIATVSLRLWLTICIITSLFLMLNGYEGHKVIRRVKRERAFDLLRLERALDSALPDSSRLGDIPVRDLKSAVDDDTKCQEKCNTDLKIGLDMVKAHTAFGSMGVPSVLDELDLQMFCRLDTAHDRCLRACGFEIQFNMRDYVCVDHYSEMLANLPCFNYASPQLKRQCGSRTCGPYKELEVSVLGFAQRCRSLVCDLVCTHRVLRTQCGGAAGVRAFRFLLDYTRTQVTAWMQDTARNSAKSVADVMPRSCSRLFCERFDATNCTYVPSSQP